MSRQKLTVDVEAFPVRGHFTISRGSRREAVVVVVTLVDQGHRGRGECVPYTRYSESVEGVVAEIRKAADDLDIADPLARDRLQTLLPPGAARNALDCALWDLEAKRSGRRVQVIAGLPPPAGSAETCYTLSLASPAEMADKGRAARDKPLLKLKLGGAGDAERLRAVRHARPDARLIADANEAWSPAELGPLLAIAREVGVQLIEQPLPAGRDEGLADIERLVPICADESAHTAADIPRLAAIYDAVNVKLDKAGGLTGALAMAQAAKAHGLKVMVGCMLSTSLSMAPALVLESLADWFDLDGPLLLAADREPAIAYSGGRISPAPPELWG